MIVPAAHGVIRVILRGEERFVLSCHEFAVMQDGLAVLPALFIVPVHHGALAVGVNRVVVDVARHVYGRIGKAVFELRVVVFQNVVVLKGDVEHVPALLNIRDARFPKQVNQIHAGDINVAEAVVLACVPKDAVHTGAALDLVVKDL